MLFGVFQCGSMLLHRVPCDSNRRRILGGGRRVRERGGGARGIRLRGKGKKGVILIRGRDGGKIIGEIRQGFGGERKVPKPTSLDPES